MTDSNNQNYINSNNYRRIRRAGQWAMGIAIFNVLGFLALVFFLNFHTGVAGFLLEILINIIVFVLGYRIHTMKYVKTNTYLKTIIGIIVFAMLVRVLSGLSLGITNVVMFVVVASGLSGFTEMKKNPIFLESLSK